MNTTTDQLNTKSAIYCAILSLIAMSVVAALFLPGLTGGFMLDDFGVLPSLYETIELCGQFCGVMSGSTGPTGRPLSLLSFAWQADSWPDPYYFKLVNLILHLLNAVLIYLIFSRVLRFLGYEGHSHWLAILSAFLWAVWPIQVSSVLYVVQRMTVLSATFVLFGVVFYLRFRPLLATEWGGKLSNNLIFYIVLGCLGVISIFVKESGVLFLMYLLAMELTVFSSKRFMSRSAKVFRIVCLYLPLSVFWAYMIFKLASQYDKYFLARDFTLGERLLTEGRILADYIGATVFPRVSDLGLYHDSYAKSVSLFEPLTTLFSLFGILFLLVVAFVYRKKATLFALAIFWFFFGHTLESTFWPLELYFEHRNYLPIAFIALGLTIGSYRIIRSSSKRYVAITFGVIFSLYILVMSVVTLGQAKLWGDEMQYGVVSAHENPDSVRARTLVIDVYNRMGLVDLAYEEFLLMKKDFSDNAGIILGDVEFACFNKKFALDPIDKVVNKLKEAKFGYSALLTIKQALEEKAEDSCQAVSYEYLMQATEALLDNPVYKRKENMLLDFKAAMFLRLGEANKAASIYESMQLAPEQWPVYVSVLATSNQLQKAYKACLDAEKALGAKPQYASYLKDVNRLKSVIAADLELNK